MLTTKKARSLVQRYADNEETVLNEGLKRAERLSRDPLQQILIFIGLFQEIADKLAKPNGGCLIASYIYQFEELNPEIREITSQSLLRSRKCLGDKFAEVIANYPPHLPVNAEELADGFVSAFEGGFVLLRVLQEPKQLNQQLAHYRNYIELLFSATPQR